GWLNRYLQADPEADATPFRAVAFGPRMPRTLQGAAPALALDDLRSFHLPGGSGSYAERLGGTVQAMYASASDPMLSSAANEMFGAVSTLQKIGVENYAPANGAQYPRGPLGRNLQQIAQLIKSGVGLEVAFAEVGGWDYHVNEGGVEGQLAARLKEFGDALAAFHLDLGDRMADVCVLTMTEFGRTARENGNRGTDHGHANVMFVLGGPVKGGKVYGSWPGLDQSQLYEGRDLAITTDFRRVLGEAVYQHLGNKALDQVFPGFENQQGKFLRYLG